MIKHFKYLFVAVSVICTYINATATRYDVGNEEGSKSKTIRNDNIFIGSAGGFQAYTHPTAKCKTLRIEFVEGSTPVAANIASTSAVSLPHTVEVLWIEGDARGFDKLVSNGRQYALPTPAAGTLIRFSLKYAPETPPLAWFQEDLPANCHLSIEPGSVDPFINTVLPLRGGTIFIGARVQPEPGFSSLLGSAKALIKIQRHPSLSVRDAHTAPLTLVEPTIFNIEVRGISMDWTGGGTYTVSDPCQVTFYKNSDIIDPTPASASNAGYFVTAGKTLQIYAPHPDFRPLPGIRSRWAEGGTSSTKVVKAPLSLHYENLIDLPR